jgi:ABC-2 type transport system permease protein
MRRYLVLFRTALRVNFGLSVLRPKQILARKRDLWMIPLVGLGIAGGVSFIIYYLKGAGWVFRLLQPMGQESAMLTFALLMGMFLVMVFGFYYVISAFYFSRDLDLLVPLPVAPAEVLASKFSVIVVNEYLTAAPLVLPVLIVYGVLSRSGPLYWIRAVAVYLLLPVIPLAVVTLIVMVLLRFVNIGRKKDALIVGGSLVLMAGVMSFQFWLNKSAGSKMDPQAFVRLFSSPDGLVQTIGARFPPSIWATRALAWGPAASGPLHFALYAGVSLLLVAAVFLAARGLFYRGLIGLGETLGRRRALSREWLAAHVTSGRHPVAAMVRREFRIMNRTPIFLLNGVLSVILIPVIFILMWNTGDRVSDAAGLLLLLGSTNATGAILGSALFMTICGCLNGTASSTFSREGGQFWMSKVIPVSPAHQVTGKFLHSLAVALLGVGAATAAAAAALHVKVGVLAAAIPLAAAASVLLTSLGMIIDLARPLLAWTNPQKAIKQNFNVLLAFFADIGILTGLTFAVIAAVKRGVRAEVIVGGTFALILVLALAAVKLLLAFAEKRYRGLEV